MKEQEKLSREEVDVLINYWIRKERPDRVLKVAHMGQGPSKEGFLKALLYLEKENYRSLDLVQDLTPQKFDEYCKMFSDPKSPFVQEIVSKRSLFLIGADRSRPEELKKAVERLENRIRRKFFFPIFSDIFQ